MNACLVIFCKRPNAADAKRRLARGIGRERANELAALMLDCALEDAAAWPGEACIAPADAADIAWLDGRLAYGWRLVPQSAGNLGVRLNAVDQVLLASKPGARIYIGSDAPGLSKDYLLAALQALKDFDVVLGPARDGGVTLMGANPPWPALNDLAWSTSELREQLVHCSHAAGLTVKQLEASFDVDEVSALLRLPDALIDDQRRARRRLSDWLIRYLDGWAA